MFQKKIGPVFLNEVSETSLQIERLKKLFEKSTGDVRDDIEKQIKLASFGKYGEENVAYELKNSGIDMYILHDIYLECDGLSAQIDYIVITRRRVYVLECKNLIGNIEIDNKGNFIRTYELMGKWYKKERIYSPITQNQRHLHVIKSLQKSCMTGFIEKQIYDKKFEDNYKSVIVIANPKSVVNMRFAPKEIKQQVIHADQLIDYIKKCDTEANWHDSREKNMRSLADFFLENAHPPKSDYVQKYEEIVEGSKNKSVSQKVKLDTVEFEQQQNLEQETLAVTNSDVLISELKKFRLEQSRKEGLKPYYIFNDAQMMDLIQKHPQSKEQLLDMKGFGQVKVDKYGDSILMILRKEYK